MRRGRRGTPRVHTIAKARTGKVPKLLTLTGTAKKRAAARGKLRQAAQVLDDRDVVAQEDAVHGPLAGVDAVDVERVDADEPRTAGDEPLRQPTGEVRVLLEVRVGAPVAIPSCVHQHGAPADLVWRERQLIDRPGVSLRNAGDDALQVCHRCERQVGEILPVRVSVERAVDVGSGVPDHLDPVDLKLGSRGVPFPRRLTTSDSRRSAALEVPCR